MALQCSPEAGLMFAVCLQSQRIAETSLSSSFGNRKKDTPLVFSELFEQVGAQQRLTGWGFARGGLFLIMITPVGYMVDGD